MRVEIIPCLKDNYSYLLIDDKNNSACVIDPSDAEPIVNFLENKNISYLGVANLDEALELKKNRIIFLYKNFK